jgi:hypothetical protein
MAMFSPRPIDLHYINIVFWLIFLLIITIGTIGGICVQLYFPSWFDILFLLQNLALPNPQSIEWFQHTMVISIQLHHCPGLHPTLHGYDNTRVKQIAKHNLCL